MGAAAHVDVTDLASSGWGVIFGPDVNDDVISALHPLLDHRKEQATRVHERYYKEYKYAGESKAEFLQKEGAGWGPADPAHVPYYILLVGDPRTLPFEFQYDLDIQHAVGRIHFDDTEDYEIYAKGVVATEAAASVSLPQEIALFGVENKDDEASQRMMRKLVHPWMNLITEKYRHLTTHLREEASKARLHELIGGGATPALLITASHSISFPANDPRQVARQGALICSDWPGPSGHKAVERDHYFAAEDLGECDLKGMIAFLFSDYSAGTPELDSFSTASLREPHQIAQYPFVSKLAQRLLSRQALAVVGHIGRTWIFSPSSTKIRANIFESTFMGLLEGHRVGFTMEYINQHHAELRAELADISDARKNGRPAGDGNYLIRVKRAMHNSRNWVVIGDPAVRLSLEIDSFREGGKFITEKLIEDEPAPVGKIATERSTTKESARAGTVLGATNDLPGLQDQLSYTDYVKAFVELIGSRNTHLPLTIGIYGSWGTGKTFLLKNIAAQLKSGERESAQPVYVVAFDAWEYSAHREIWPGLVREIMEGLERRMPWRSWKRFGIRCRRNFKRQWRYGKGPLVLFTIVSILMLLILAAAALFTNSDIKLFFSALNIVLAAGLAGFLKRILDTPLGQWVSTVFKTKEYGEHHAYMEDIRDDLEFLRKQLKPENARMLVVIDDLDRCEPQRAVEMLKAVNLLLNFESFVVVLGIDARVTTCAIEKHYEGVLGEAGASGYEYLDKIIQIPFRIPRPNRMQLKQFIDEQLEVSPEEEPEVASEPSLTAAPPEASSADEPNKAKPLSEKPAHQEQPEPDGKPPLEKTPIEPKIEDRDLGFTFAEHGAFVDLIPFLNPNPRCMKRLFNVYRLIRRLAQSRAADELLETPASTIHLMVLSAQWPYTTYMMMRCFEDLALLPEEERAELHIPEEDPLPFLLKRARDYVDPQQQKHFDYDIEVLDRLLADSTLPRVNWGQLGVGREFMIHFNPAVEFATSHLPPAGGAKEDSSAGGVIDSQAGTGTERKSGMNKQEQTSVDD